MSRHHWCIALAAAVLVFACGEEPPPPTPPPPPAKPVAKAPAPPPPPAAETTPTDKLGVWPYLSRKHEAAIAVMPKILTVEFFRRDVAHRIRCVAIAPGYVDTPMVRGIHPTVLARLVDQVPIRRLIEPDEVASLVMELYRNEALAGDVYFIHGGLRLGSKG